jgi:hypothetical protein
MGGKKREREREKTKESNFPPYYSPWFYYNCAMK